MTEITLEWAFDAAGDFRPGYDPCRPGSYEDNPKLLAIHNFLFDERGHLNFDLHLDLFNLIVNKNWRWTSDAVKLYYAQEMGNNTKGSYPAIFMWR